MTVLGESDEGTNGTDEVASSSFIKYVYIYADVYCVMEFLSWVPEDVFQQMVCVKCLTA